MYDEEKHPFKQQTAIQFALYGLQECPHIRSRMANPIIGMSFQWDSMECSKQHFLVEKNNEYHWINRDHDDDALVTLQLNRNKIKLERKKHQPTNSYGKCHSHTKIYQIRPNLMMTSKFPNSDMKSMYLNNIIYIWIRLCSCVIIFFFLFFCHW